MDNSGANQKYESVRERLFAPHAAFSYENHSFMVELMREYLKRIAGWHTVLKLTHERSIAIWPFGNIIAAVAPEFANDSEIEADADLWKRISHPAGTALVRSALYWSKYQPQIPLLANHALDEPYEPALMFFEIGGYFWTEHGFICVDATMITMRTAAHWLPQKLY